MDKLSQSEFPTAQMEASAAPTQMLPRGFPEAQKNEEAFRDGQSRVLEMIAANAPLAEILERLVLLIEAQAPEAICRSIIEAHGGRLWAESNIGPGTTFKFTLPAGA